MTTPTAFQLRQLIAGAKELGFHDDVAYFTTQLNELEGTTNG